MVNTEGLLVTLGNVMEGKIDKERDISDRENYCEDADTREGPHLGMTRWGRGNGYTTFI